MHAELLTRLRCPKTGATLSLVDAEHEGARVRKGTLVSAQGGHRYPVHDFIPRFVPASNYADNFGMQWNIFRQTQLDSHSGVPVSANRFWNATGWTPEEMRGKWILDAGCGSGRFAEVALSSGANVIALDYSSAVDAARTNLAHHENLHLVQGNIYELPFPKQSFDLVYSLGVLQHTPDVRRAFDALPPMVVPGGKLCVDYYWRRLRTMFNIKYAIRPWTRRIPQDRLFEMLQRRVPGMLRLSQAVRRVPLLGRGLQRLIPVVDYTGVYPLSPKQLEEWALLDTFDMLAPHYDNPQTRSTARQWFEAAGFDDIRVFKEGHLVARGVKRA